MGHSDFNKKIKTNNAILVAIPIKFARIRLTSVYKPSVIIMIILIIILMCVEAFMLGLFPGKLYY